MTHPAFISMGTNGLWVGKFETTGTISSLSIKPNSLMLNLTDVKDMFQQSINYSRENNSHMAKNTEWGAIAYLTNSDYGRCSNGICEEVRINNCPNWITGLGAVSELEITNQATCLNVESQYNNTYGKLSSTTKNLSGIYGMAGGGWEYVAAVMDGNVGKSSFLMEDIYANKQYFDIYNENSSRFSYNYRVLGDATGELGPFSSLNQYHSSWFGDTAAFLRDNLLPWFYRGGHYDNNERSGIFFFGSNTGINSVEGGQSFRIVLAPQ